MSGGKPSFQLRENIRSILISRGLDNEKIDDLLDDIPKRWEKFDDIALIPNTSFRDEQWESIINDEFWTKVCQSLSIERLARSGEIV